MGCGVYSWWWNGVGLVPLQLLACVCAAAAVSDGVSGCECAVCSHFMEEWADCLIVALKKESFFIRKLM